MRQSIRSSHALCKAVDLPPQAEVQSDFPVLAPMPLVRLIQKSCPNDPILQQLLATPQETVHIEGYSSDPLAESQYTPAPGIIHKYRGRVLLIATGACALHCRYCFRREFPYTEHAAGQLSAALDYLKRNTDIQEVILSGGDPLSLSESRFDTLIRSLDEIPHLNTIRLHTRFPLAIPQRVNVALLNSLSHVGKNIVVVIHANHAQELGDAQRSALVKLRRIGTLLNQSVLLRGVNNSAEALEELSRRLFECGVLPYYVHQLDTVKGAAHFAVPDSEALEIHEQLRNNVPGYLLPRLVREIPGEKAKSAL